MGIVLKSRDINFTNIPVGSDGIVSTQVEQSFDTEVKSAEVVLKAFKLVHMARDNHLYECGAEITNVSLDGSTVRCTVSLQLVDNNDNTLDPDKVNMSIVFITDCE